MTDDNNSPAKKTKRCPHCAEHIQAAAKKCRYCSEWLEGRQKVPTVKRASPNRRWKTVRLIALVGLVSLVVRVGYEFNETNTEAGYISDYTNRLADIFRSECPSLTRVEGNEFAMQIRDKQLKGNIEWCPEGVLATTCLRGPPKGYPPLDRVVSFVRMEAQMLCK